MKIVENSICAPQGFVAGATYSGIRNNPDKPDLALIVSEKIDTVCVGVFTKNNIKAAPVIWTENNLKKNICQAVVINSGNANACTGLVGHQHTEEMAKATGSELGIEYNKVAVASTGVIGEILPIDKVINGIKIASGNLSRNGGSLAAQAIMTTDTFPKSIALKFTLDEKTVYMGGIAKGSGMIHPNMATMLGFITTDIDINANCLKHALKTINENSFNMISVDAETSTNDMLLIMANGMANNAPITSIEDPNWFIFYNALNYLCTFLAKEIARDGEGATKLIEVEVTGAETLEHARLAARTVCCSPLVKTTIFGEDANWGRIACAIGYSGAKLNLENLTIAIGNISLFKSGKPQVYNEKEISKILQKNNILISVDLGAGSYKATSWGCDLTYDYIKINASYRS